MKSGTLSAIQHQFDRHAHFWNLLGSPLRPCAEDMHLMHNCFNKWRSEYRSTGSASPLRALLLGITPEIAVHEWGVPVDLTAVDISRGMIASVWPGNTRTRRALCMDWLELPDGLSLHGKEQQFDIVLADGVFTLLNYPVDYRKLAGIIRRSLKSDGIFMLRPFLRPALAETPENIFAELLDNRIGNFHAFKWRLLMSIQGDDISRGVAIVKAWEMYHRHIPSHAYLADITGWPVETIATIDAYQHSTTVYTYSNFAELAGAALPYLASTGREAGHYELAERCPVLSFRPR